MEKNQLVKVNIDIPVYRTYNSLSGDILFEFNNTPLAPSLFGIPIFRLLRQSDQWSNFSRIWEYFRIRHFDISFSPFFTEESSQFSSFPPFYVGISPCGPTPSYLTYDYAPTLDSSLEVYPLGILKPVSKRFYLPPICSSPSLYASDLVLGTYYTGITWGSTVWHSFCQFNAFSKNVNWLPPTLTDGFEYPLWVIIGQNLVGTSSVSFDPINIGSLRIEIYLELSCPCSYTGDLTPLVIIP